MGGARSYRPVISMELQKYKPTLERAGVVFEPGLSAQEIHQIETNYGFRFPLDYCAFLMDSLPVSRGFVDWRNADEKQILKMLSWPYEGVCFDILHNNFWLQEWGSRPLQLSDAYAIAQNAIDQAPTLIPIRGHRYIPDAPTEAGNPIFSVYQTDIIYYGRDLGEYLENEFGYHFFGKGRHIISEPVKSIAFWSYLVDINNGIIADGGVK